MKNFISFLLLALFLSTASEAQIFDKIKKTVDKVGEKVNLKKLQRDPVSTSFSDVEKRNTMSVTFGNTQSYANIHTQPFTNERGFALTPGYYESFFDSFCIKAGTYAPTSGSGRFYAELEGPKADIFETILRAFEEGRVEKRDAQLLFWAIIAKTDFAKMKGQIKVIALNILSAKEIALLSTNALENLAKDELRQLSYKSKAARAIIEAENSLRAKYYNAVNNYAEYEEIAMLAGVEPVVSGWESGKWTKHPDGYFLRYYPSGYQKTKTQIYVPEDAGTVYFNGFGDVAVPANTSGQRLLQSNSPYGGVIVTSNQNNAVGCREVSNPLIDAAIKEQMIMQNLPGLAVGVFKNGKIIHLKGYGYTNIVDKKEINNQTVMHWASVSKSVTALAALQLQQDPSANYSITDLVSKHCSYWPQSVNYRAIDGTTGTDSRHRQVTVQNALLNRSGINHYGNGRNGDSTLVNGKFVRFANNSGYTVDDNEFNGSSSVGVFNNSVLDYAPGANYSYTTYGFNLVGATVEEASPNGYVDWIMKNVADVAGMNSLRVANRKDSQGKDIETEGHDMPSDGILKIVKVGDKESVLPGGGWESNICDFTKYAIGLASGQFLDQSKDSLWDASNRTRFVDSNGNTTNFYSYGVRYLGSGANLSVWHGGKHNNLRSNMHFFPSDTTGIVLIAPVEYADLPLLTRYIYQSISERTTLYNNLTQTPTDKCRVDMKSGNDRFNAVWRKTNKDVIIRTGRPNDEFYEEAERLRSKGYHCKDFEPFLHNGKLYWDGVFQKGIAPTKMWRNANKEAFVAKSKEMKEQGYRLYDVETYLNENGKRLWAGIFRKTNDGYSVRLDRTTEEFAEVRESENANGKKLIDVEVYLKDNKLFWSGVFTDGSPNLLNRNYKVDDFNDLVDQRQNEGYKLIDVEHYQITSNGRSEYRVAGIWEKSTQTEKRRSFNDFCEIMDFHESFSNSGYELIDWNRIVEND